MAIGLASLLDPGLPGDALARVAVGYGVRDRFVGTGAVRSIIAFLPPGFGGGGKLLGSGDGVLDIIVSIGERGILPGGGAFGGYGPG